MKSPSHFSKSKLKDGNQTNRIQNFKIEINYISSLSNKKESSYRQNNPLFNEKIYVVQIMNSLLYPMLNF